MPKGYRFVDHTGDAAVMVFGESLPELFEQAAAAFFELITEPQSVRETHCQMISIKGEDVEELLVQWLGEFLFLFDTRSLLFKSFKVKRMTEKMLEATAKGEPYREDLHPIKRLVKAVTYHQLKVSKEKGLYRARIVFDL